MYTIRWPEWDTLINHSFIPFLENKDRYLVLYGGRGSSKSDFAAKKLIYRCLNEKYFRCVLVRNTYATIQNSSYDTIKDIIFDLGLQELFTFKLQPLEIHCINGNRFLARGCDDTTKLKSIKDPTCVWYEEDIPTESDFITITTGVRTTKADYLQEIFTINPEVEGNYQDHWFWKRYFLGRDEKSFNGVTEIMVPVLIGEVFEDKPIHLTYTVHHSTYKDNKWIPNEFIAFLIDLKNKNPYYWEVYCNGNWGNRILGGLFYKSFSIGRNTLNWNYDTSLALHITFDFNRNPYMSCSVWQVVGSAAYCIDEVAMKSPDNKTDLTAREFLRRYNNHKGGLFVYGDPSGQTETTSDKQGENNFTIIIKELAKLKPIKRVAVAHPSVTMRGNFINSAFEGSIPGLRIYVYEKSVYLKNDLLFTKEASDGTKLKEEAKDDNGVRSQKYGHFSDGMDYMLCEAFSKEYDEYQNGPMNHDWIIAKIAQNDNRL